MKEIIERLESLEDLLQQVIVRIEEQGKREIKLPELEVPDYSGQLEQIWQEISDLKQQGAVETTVNQLEDVKKQLQAVRQLQLAKALPQVKQYRFTFFPEQIRQPEYYKIMVLGFLGLVFLILTYLLLNKLTS